MTSVIAGLNSVEASRRLAEDGPNQLPQPRRPSALRHFGKQFTHLLAILLWVASGRALLAGQPALAVAIVVVIVLNAIFAFAQEYRADRSAERLRSLLPMSARVRREGQLRVIDATQLVRGDLVVLRPGDRISGDLNLTVSHARGYWRQHDDRRHCCTHPAGSPTPEPIDRPAQPRRKDHRGHCDRHRRAAWSRRTWTRTWADASLPFRRRCQRWRWFPKG